MNFCTNCWQFEMFLIFLGLELIVKVKVHVMWTILIDSLVFTMGEVICAKGTFFFSFFSVPLLQPKHNLLYLSLACVFLKDEIFACACAVLNNSSYTSGVCWLLNVVPKCMSLCWAFVALWNSFVCMVWMTFILTIVSYGAVEAITCPNSTSVCVSLKGLLVFT